MSFGALRMREGGEIWCADCGCRFELALGWYGELDSIDLAALGVLSHGPSVRSHLCATHMC